MGEVFIALSVLVALLGIKTPGKVYDVAAGYYRRKLQKSMDAWKELVTIDTDEEHAILAAISDEKHHQYSKYEERRAEFDAFLETLKEQYPGYTGGYGHDRNTGLPERVEIGFQRVILAKRGKLSLVDALFGISGDDSDAPFVLWIDGQLKEHGVDEKVYFMYRTDIFKLDDIPKRTLGEYKWDPQINAGYKRPE